MGDTAATMQCLDVVIFRPASGLLGCYASPAFCHSDSHWVSTTVHLDLCLEGRIWKMKVSTILAQSAEHYNQMVNRRSTIETFKRFIFHCSFCFL